MYSQTFSVQPRRHRRTDRHGEPVNRMPSAPAPF